LGVLPKKKEGKCVFHFFLYLSVQSELLLYSLQAKAGKQKSVIRYKTLINSIVVLAELL